MADGFEHVSTDGIRTYRQAKQFVVHRDRFCLSHDPWYDIATSSFHLRADQSLIPSVVSESSMPTVVIFDLFGTLIRLKRDTHPYLKLCQATNSLRKIRESLVVNAPMLTDFCDQLALPHPPNIADLQCELDRDVKSASLFDNSMTTLIELRERCIKIALISNLASPYRKAFHNLELEHFFECVIFSCDVGLAKPNPEIYRLVLERLNVDANSVIMVGDKHRADVDGPMTCGIRGFLINRDGESSGDSDLRALTDVLSLLDS